MPSIRPPSIFDTPLVRSTTSRWPRRTFEPRVTTTFPTSRRPPDVRCLLLRTGIGNIVEAVLIGVLLTLFYRRSVALWPVVLAHYLTDHRARRSCAHGSFQG